VWHESARQQLSPSRDHTCVRVRNNRLSVIGVKAEVSLETVQQAGHASNSNIADNLDHLATPTRPAWFRAVDPPDALVNVNRNRMASDCLGVQIAERRRRNSSEDLAMNSRTQKRSEIYNQYRTDPVTFFRRLANAAEAGGLRRRTSPGTAAEMIDLILDAEGPSQIDAPGDTKPSSTTMEDFRVSPPKGVIC
jgi:hypothetical protein